MDLRTVVLALSPRAAEALERKLSGTRLKPNDAALLRQVGDEVNAQLNALATGAELAPAPITEDCEPKRIAARMAQAGLDAVKAVA